VDERQAPHVPIVPRPGPDLDPARVAAAAGAVLAQFEELQRVVGHRPELLAHLHGGNAVRADDDHGRARGLVVQADELRWSELQELARVAGPQADLSGHAGVGGWHQDCPACHAALAIARIRAHQPGGADPDTAQPSS
jgi:hypothetical protein